MDRPPIPVGELPGLAQCSRPSTGHFPDVVLHDALAGILVREVVLHRVQFEPSVLAADGRLHGAVAAVESIGGFDLKLAPFVRPGRDADLIRCADLPNERHAGDGQLGIQRFARLVDHATADEAGLWLQFREDHSLTGGQSRWIRRLGVGGSDVPGVRRNRADYSS